MGSGATGGGGGFGRGGAGISTFSTTGAETRGIESATGARLSVMTVAAGIGAGF